MIILIKYYAPVCFYKVFRIHITFKTIISLIINFRLRADEASNKKKFKRDRSEFETWTCLAWCPYKINFPEE